MAKQVTEQLLDKSERAAFHIRRAQKEGIKFDSGKSATEAFSLKCMEFGIDASTGDTRANCDELIYRHSMRMQSEGD